jgi:hypothetical protein
MVLEKRKGQERTTIEGHTQFEVDSSLRKTTLEGKKEINKTI